VGTVEVLGLVVTAALSVQFALYLRSGKVKRDFAVLRVLKGGKWVGALLGSWAVVFVVVVVGLLLMALSPGIMGWTWLQLLPTPTGQPEAGRNLLVSGLAIPGYAWVFLALFAANVPRLAMNEEIAFRKGFKKPGQIVFQSFKFGLAHCLVGVPIGFGLALALAGGWFAWQYLKGGTRRSAAYHSLHNWTLLSLAAVWMLTAR